MSKQLIQEISEYVYLYRDDKTGIAWIENGSTGMYHSAHPNIHYTGSVKGMKDRGYWGRDDITMRCNGFIYNVSHLVISDEYDQIAADNCRCICCAYDDFENR